MNCEYCQSINSLIIDYREGITVCTECGVVSEEGMCFSSQYIDSMYGRNSSQDLFRNDHYGNKKIHHEYNVCDLVKDEAKQLEQKMLKYKIVRGKNVKGFHAACLFLSFKKLSLSRTIEEVSQQYGISSQLLSKSIKNIEKHTTFNDIDYDINTFYDVDVNVDHNPLELLNRFISIIFSEDKNKTTRKQVKKRVEKIYEETELIFLGKSPKTIICSIIIYLLDKEPNLFTENDIGISKTEICQHLNISKVTINKSIKLLIDFYK
jgi:transcription initiation factor TFIIIB Brf1 subunit/transcription initiation factor TFIIB